MSSYTETQEEVDIEQSPPLPVAGEKPPKKRAARKMTVQDMDGLAISICKGEKIRWEVATAFITDRISFKMRNLIRILRKNYYGVFDSPIDQYTGLEKIWYPLTEINVEAVVHNIDIDEKDLNFRATNPDGYAFTDITRAYVKEKLKHMDFGQKIDDAERAMAIDGTVVWKTWEEENKLMVQQVDLLNVYLDPTSPSIQKAYRFTERSLQDQEQISAMTGWRNTSNLPMAQGLPRTDPYYTNRATGINSNVKSRDVYEMWGKIPKALITGLWADMRTEVDGHLVVSGIDTPGMEVCHLIEKNIKKNRDGEALKPYEECWYTRVPNRWYGRGIAEKLLTLQVYSNIVFNVRINRSRVSQLGLFKVKKGAGVTPQMITRLQSNGVVVLNDLDDLQQLTVEEVGQSSYQDEEVINTLSERLTNAFEVATGESMPASTPATNAAIQNQAAKSGFQIIKDNMGYFLQRWMDRHALPILSKELNAKEIIRISMEEDNYSDIVERALFYYAVESLKDTTAKGFMPTPQQMIQGMLDARDKLKKRDLFVNLVDKIQSEMLETQFFVTNEDMDVPTTINNLIALLPAAPEYRDSMLKMAFDLMGLGQLQKTPQPTPQPPQGSQGQPIPPGQASVPGGIPNQPNIAPAGLAPR